MSRYAILAIALCSALAEAASLEVQVRDPSGAAVADAAVYAMPANGPADARGARTVTIEQRDRDFVPFVTVLQTGTPVSFPNRDPILHHVYSFSPAKSFEIKLYSGTPPGEIVFDKPGVVTLGCNIHDWMVAYVVAVQTPHFGRTDARGDVRLRDLPAGSYEVHVYHPYQRAPVTPATSVLEALSNQRMAFTLDASQRKARYKPPMDRARY